MSGDSSHLTSEPRASRTALGVAWLRAAHQLVDAPRILEDPIAVPILGPDTMRHLEARRQDLDTPGARGWRSHVVMRSRYAEDRLAAAAARGVRQYVLLGAGYDTFAWRQPDWAHAMRIFEVDQPATQAAKRDACGAARLDVPRNLTFVPVNFERDQLGPSLSAAGVVLDAPVCFSWLGVMPYISEEASDDVFRLVAACPPSSEIILSFAPRDASRLTRTAVAVAALGEPWRTFIDADELAQRLKQHGFTRVDFLTPGEAEARYFRNRSDSLPPPRRASIAAAIV